MTQITAFQQYYKHFHKRLLERYKITLTKTIYQEIIRQIKDQNRITKVKVINNQRVLHCVEIEGKEVFVVYRRRKQALITALTPRNSYIELWETKKKLYGK